VVEKICERMSAEEEDVNVCLAGCQVFWILSRMEIVVPLLNQVDTIIPCIKEVPLTRFMTNKQVLADIGKAIERFSRTDIPFKTALRDAGIAQKLGQAAALIQRPTYERLYKRLEQAQEAVLHLSTSKRAREMFGDEIKLLDDKVIKLLVDGALMTKFHNRVKPGPRFVQVDKDLQILYFKDPGMTAEETAKREAKGKFQWINLLSVSSVAVGRCIPLLERKTLTRKYYADENKCFALLSEKKSVGLQCNSQEERDAWVTALDIVVKDVKTKLRKQHLEMVSKRTMSTGEPFIQGLST